MPPVTSFLQQFAATDVTALDRRYLAVTRGRRLRLLGGLVALAAVFALACWMAEVQLDVLGEKIGNFFNYIDAIFYLDDGTRAWLSPVEWFWGLPRWLLSLGETILMAYSGTLLGALLALALAFPASRNFARSAVTRMLIRRLLEFCRTVPDLVFALIFVIAFGLGPMPGVLAIAVHTIGALGKQFAEVIENIDLKPVEGIAASGGTRLQQIRFGAIPQVQSNFLSYALLRFEINVRSAAVLGFVGAGGIGYTLVIAIRKFYYSDVSAMLLLIIATVMLIDFLTEQLRHALLGANKGH